MGRIGAQWLQLPYSIQTERVSSDLTGKFNRDYRVLVSIDGDFPANITDNWTKQLESAASKTIRIITISRGTHGN